MTPSQTHRPVPSPVRSFRQLRSLDQFSYSLRVFVALAGVMAGCSIFGALDLVIPLFLGVIAGALAETDDSWWGRAKAVAITLALFAVSAFCVGLFAPTPWLFVAAMIASTFTLSMSGALGARYTTIAHATLTLAVYAMLGLEQVGATPDLWRAPLLLTLGAAWYGLLSVVWQALLPFEPVTLGLAGLFDEVGAYLEEKSALFEPRRHPDIEGARVLLARRNGGVVIALNRVKELIRRRVATDRDDPRVERCLALFFTAQDIHERASSSHIAYEDFTRAFFHSDVMFRCRRLLQAQGRACRALARRLRGGPAVDTAESGQALEDLHASMAFLKARDLPDQRPLMPSLGDLVANLEALQSDLERTEAPADPAAAHPDTSLFDDSPGSLAEAGRRVMSHLTPASPVFRHALRLTLALGVGYCLKILVHPAQGYWILLTALFVCLPNYASTRRRLWQRIAGTVLGLLAGWALITLFPAREIQQSIAVVAGVAFFVWRTGRYTLATGAITLMVLCCFNQVVDGYSIIWPRLIDTLIGSAISGLVVVFVLPDWQGRQLHKGVAATLTGASGYLRALIRQYGSSKSDDLAYRVARRTAQEADAALSTTLSNMLQEPERHRRDADACMRHLVLSHTLLSYLSALGAHRDALPALAPDRPLGRAALRLAGALDDLAADLAARRAVALDDGTDDAIARDLADVAGPIDDRERLVRTQLALICRQLAPIRRSAQQIQATIGT
ncbi:TIGR01666 family membrane protein [Siculibacillus lacustris]|uniref:TIGR01666 family membrane protein n=1 Tax=Siculibacillus lacustris TaxID=1549641 RepID=A0A4Q9VWL2_9HYPH|nr:YccS family putative transporter [Siculibacillus lacustris]TBW40720.1 TIGR01666 family membrane protein [Siculibacillus lacustris]